MNAIDETATTPEQSLMKSIGSVQGRIAAIDLQAGFSLTLTSRFQAPVVCSFAAGLLDEVRAALGKRVIAYGTIYRFDDARNTVAHAEIQRFDVLPEPTGGRFLSDLYGIMANDPRSFDEVLQEIRGE